MDNGGTCEVESFDDITERGKPCLNWDDELPPMEISSMTYTSGGINFNDSSDGSSSLYSTITTAEVGSSRTFVCLKNSASPSEDEILQKINVSKIIGDEEMDASDVTVDMIIPTNKVGLVIGKGGKNIKALQEKSGARMQVIQHSNTYDEYEKTLRLVGPPDLVQHARQLVYELISRSHDNPYDQQQQPRSPPTTRNRISRATSEGGGRFKTIRYPVPKIAVGLIIGRGGETIKKIRNETGAKVQFEPVNENLRDMDEQQAIVSGKSEQIQHACDQIEDLVSTALRGYQRRESGAREKVRRPLHGYRVTDDEDDSRSSHQSYRSKYTERRVPVPMAKVKLLLGKARETIKAISMQSGAYCDMDRDAPTDGPDRIFLLKGLPHQVEFATELIMDKLYGKKFAERSSVEQPSPRRKNDMDDNAKPVSHNNEWGQGDPSSPWSCQEAHQDGGNNGGEVSGRNSRCTSYGYSQWLEYFQPERQQAQADAWEEKVKAEQSNHGNSAASPEHAHANHPLTEAQPPPFHESNSSKYHEECTENFGGELNDDWKKTTEMTESSTDFDDDANPEDKQQQIPKINPQKVCPQQEQNCTTNPNFAQVHPHSIPPPNGYPQPGYPPMTSGCTRVVTLYYDINSNSVVVLNQLHYP